MQLWKEFWRVYLKIVGNKFLSIVYILLNLGIEGQSVEVSNIVDIRKEYNREIAMRISSNINSQNRFYTDLNGYQVISLLNV